MVRNWLQEAIASDHGVLIRNALHERPQNKMQLHRTTRLSRPTIDKYLKALQATGEVYRKARIFYLSDKGLSELKRLEQIRAAQRREAVEVKPTTSELHLSNSRINSRFRHEVERLSGENLLSCYVCGKCSAGCPFSSAMDIQPHQIIRLIQLGQESEALNAKTIWLCSSCYTCATRCPRGVSLTNIMEALRSLQLRKGVDHTSPSQIPSYLLDKLPQLALVSGFRKLSG